jgi:hypothetical protein
MISGSARTARRAGTKQLRALIMRIAAATTPNVNGSVALMPNNRPFSSRVSHTAATTPVMIPANASFNPSTTTIEDPPVEVDVVGAGDVEWTEDRYDSEAPVRKEEPYPPAGRREELS